MPPESRGERHVRVAETGALVLHRDVAGVAGAGAAHHRELRIAVREVQPPAAVERTQMYEALALEVVRFVPEPAMTRSSRPSRAT